jgi:hypothetical protein
LTTVQSAAGLNFTADIHITVLSIGGGMFRGDPLQELFHVNLNVSTLSTLADLALAIDQKQFQSIQVGTVLDILPFYHSHHHSGANSSAEKACIVDSIQKLRMDDLDLHSVIESATLVPQLESENGEVHQVKGSTMLNKKLEEDLDNLLNHFLKLALQEYQPTITASLSGLVRRPLAGWINHWIQDKLRNYLSPDFDRTENSVVVGLPGSTLGSEDKRCSSGREHRSKQSSAGEFFRCRLAL